MNGDFLLDTNAFISLIKKETPLENLPLSSKFYLSIITEMELLSFSRLTDSEKQLICDALNTSCVINIADEIKTKTIELRRRYNLKLPDAIIAATSIVKALPLITNDKTFSKVHGLKLISVDELLNQPKG